MNRYLAKEIQNNDNERIHIWQNKYKTMGMNRYLAKEIQNNENE